MKQIISVTETFSTDTAALRYASSSEYTLSTLANAPVGTYITFTYAANTNSITQTTVRPTQTDSNMNSNGFLLTARAFNVSSTAGSPSTFAIQVGKGLKGLSVEGFFGTGKTTSGSIDTMIGGATEFGVYRQYNEVTGILLVDAGICANGGSSTSRTVLLDVVNNVARPSGYLVINASKSPALTGVSINRVAARVTHSNGQVIATGTTTKLIFDNTKTYDTHGAFNPTTGTFTAPENGFYQVSGSITYSHGVVSTMRLLINKNGSTISQARTISSAIAAIYYVSRSDTIYLAKGDILEFFTDQNTGSSQAIPANTSENTVSIVKVSGIN